MRKLLMLLFQKYLEKVHQGKKNYEAITFVEDRCVLIREGQRFPLKKLGIVLVQNGRIEYQYIAGSDAPDMLKGTCIIFKHEGVAASFSNRIFFEHDEDSSENSSFLLFYYRWGSILHIVMAKQGNKMLFLENYEYPEVDENSEQSFLEILFSPFMPCRLQTDVESEEVMYE